MPVDSIDYGDGRNLQDSRVTTDQVPLGIDTYYPGMELEFAVDKYIALATDANVAAIYNGEEKTLAAAGFGYCIMGGEVPDVGIVTDANVQKTFTELQRATRRDKGFYLKRV